jgi:hypothetical protein
MEAVLPCRQFITAFLLLSDPAKETKTAISTAQTAIANAFLNVFMAILLVLII